MAVKKIGALLSGAVIFSLFIPISVFGYGLGFDNIAVNQSETMRLSPYRDSLTGRLYLRNEQAHFGRKFIRGSICVLSFEALSTMLLFALPQSYSNWKDPSAAEMRANFRRAYSKPPVFDKDHWSINYVGHPFMGSYMYNAVRSQNAKVWQASLFCIGHVLLWEYVFEAFSEQPSAQDLIVTPLAGILLGEGIHRLTVLMSRNGFKWYEIAATMLINPMYGINNGFKFAKPRLAY